MNILLLENDDDFSKIMSSYLLKNNFLVTVVFDGEQAEELIYTNCYDLLLLNINVSIINGLDLAKKLKIEGFTIPIIFITESLSLDDFHKAYAYGANDFIRKPFVLDELLTRIKYIQEHFLIDSNKIISITKQIQFNLSTMSIEKDGETTYLSKKESGILKYFLLNKNRIIGINELIINVWGYEKEPSIATIRTYIKNIRKYLSKDLFETVKGSGYIIKI
jgi:DNA-binding response OmpR family regulator